MSLPVYCIVVIIKVPLSSLSSSEINLPVILTLKILDASRFSTLIHFCEVLKGDSTSLTKLLKTDHRKMKERKRNDKEMQRGTDVSPTDLQLVHHVLIQLRCGPQRSVKNERFNDLLMFGIVCRFSLTFTQARHTCKI